jgi:UDP-N-acetylglucosamine--N-acetylmuramyl-(pentapeptide) pyrophosphoryl-undecaprenol N-acetylglucosamine transferase
MKVLIAAGGSGGHIFPAIALARSLQNGARSDVDIKFVGSDKALDRRIFEKEGFKFSLVSANKFPYKPSLELVPFFIKLKIDVIKMLFAAISYKPDIVVGFGGYASFPVIMAAAILGIPRIVHEQNFSPGRANKVLFRFADKIAVSFNQTASAKVLGRNASKCVFTGNPLRRQVLKDDRDSGIKLFALDGKKFTILVIGGSQGSHFLNESFINAMSQIDKGLRSSFQVIHLTGIKDYEWAVKAYAGIDGLESRVHSFIDRIEEAYSSADLAITRAGSSAIFELACFAKAMILVPYPFAMSHQVENAKAFEEEGAAMVIEENKLSAEAFKDNILRLFKDRDLLKKIGNSAKRLSRPDASDKFAGEVIKLSEK